jgi:hypothetical protein
MSPRRADRPRRDQHDFAGGARCEQLGERVDTFQYFALTDADPSHPYGGPDGGRDAVFQKDGEAWLMAVYFPRSSPSFTEIKARFKSDLSSGERYR